jgi:hypothetical protein
MSVIEVAPHGAGVKFGGHPIFGKHRSTDASGELVDIEQAFQKYIAHREAFSDTPKALAAVREFEMGVFVDGVRTLQSFGDVVAKYGPVLKDLSYNFMPDKNPAFTFLNEKNLVVPLFTGHAIGSFSPNLMKASIMSFKGLVNAQSAFPESYVKGGEAASGGLFHILIIPSSITDVGEAEKPLRIYNAVTLNGSHKNFLETMRTTAINYVLDQVQVARAHPDGACDLMNRTAMEMAKKLEPPGKPSLLAEGTTLEQWNNKLWSRWQSWLATNEPIQLGFFFHAHPDHTVGHLHMHCFPLNRALRTNKIHDEKCIPLESVLRAL